MRITVIDTWRNIPDNTTTKDKCKVKQITVHVAYERKRGRLISKVNM